MKLNICFLFFVLRLIPAYSAEEVVPGVLIKVENLNSVEKKSFEVIKKRYSLKESKQYKNSNVLQLDFNNKKTLKSAALSACQDLISVPGISFCEPDYKLTIENNDRITSCTEECTTRPVLSKSLNNIVEELKCELVPQKDSPHYTEGLSTYWAQEYTGSDLVREKLKEMSLELPKDLIGIWDAKSQDESIDHGELVSNLIAGPSETSLIPSTKALPFDDLESVGDYLESYEQLYKSCKQDINCPKYINNSMGWRNSKFISDVVKNISEKSVFITAADNSSRMMDFEKRTLSAQSKVITVSSIGHNGLGIEYTNMAPEITIAAFSGEALTTSDNFTNLKKFNGTSAAAPQVTAALASFSLITGHNLSTPQAEALLKKTALKFPFYPTKNALGAGLLNTYQIFEIANQIASVCKQSVNKGQCVSSELKKDETYHFEDKSTEILKQAEKSFPSCFDKNEDTTIASCSEKRKTFKELRKISLLHPEQGNIWKLLSCSIQTNGLSKNAEYYRNMSERDKKTDKELSNDLLNTKFDISHFIRYVLPTLSTSEASKTIEKLMQDKKNYNEISKYVLINPEFQRKDWVSQIIKSSENRSTLALYVLQMNHWTQYPELVEEFIQNEKSDMEIDIFILSKPEWQQVFKTRYNIDHKVTSKELREKLSKK